MLDRALVGTSLGCLTVDVEKGRLRSFAKAIGEASPEYIDETAARAAGHRGLPVPPTYYFCLPMLDEINPVKWLEDLGINIQNVLHGEQRFEYFQMAFAGDQLVFDRKISDIYCKKNGALEFIVTETTVTNEAGELVARMMSSIVVRHPAGVRE